MDENMEAFVFMVFGLGFFIFVIWLTLASDRSDRRYDDRQYARRLMEAREFGFDPRYRHNVDTLKGDKKK